MKVCEIDLRVGGKWRYVVQMPDGNEFAFSGEYLEIAPPERLVSTEWFEAIPGSEYHVTAGQDHGIAPEVLIPALAEFFLN